MLNATGSRPSTVSRSALSTRVLRAKKPCGPAPVIRPRTSVTSVLHPLAT
nr:hypothetical protein [Micromonospora sp. 4G55]